MKGYSGICSGWKRCNSLGLCLGIDSLVSGPFMGLSKLVKSFPLPAALPIHRKRCNGRGEE